MSPVVILLIIIGLALIIISYAFAEKLEGVKPDESVVKIPKELNDEQKEKIQKLIDKCMDEKIDSKLGEVEDKFSKIVNEKTLALGDYAVTVNEEIEKNHNEVMFLYNMLSDKQKEIMTTANMVDDYRKDIDNLVKNNNIATKQRENDEMEAEMNQLANESEGEATEEISESDSNKDIILEMHKQGLSILEIAKQLGLGVGEVKLVVDLYQGAKK